MMDDRLSPREKWIVDSICILREERMEDTMPSERFMRLPEEKRKRICAAAMQEFMHHPYAQVSINQIIRGAEIPRGSFYQYFEDKKDLFLYLMDTWKETVSTRMLELLKEHEGNAFRLMDYLIDFVIDHVDDEKIAMMRNILSEEWIFDLLWCDLKLNPFDEECSRQLKKFMQTTRMPQSTAEDWREFNAIAFFGRNIMGELFKLTVVGRKEDQTAEYDEKLREQFHYLVHSLETHYTKPD